METLTWLPNNLLKDIKLPKIIVEENTNQNYSGYYIFGTSELVIVENGSDEGTIAHEFCHYLQYNRGIKSIPQPFKIIDTYENAIKKYFTTNIIEYEALLFEHKYAKTSCNDWWLRKLVLE